MEYPFQLIIYGGFAAAIHMGFVGVLRSVQIPVDSVPWRGHAVVFLVIFGMVLLYTSLK